MKRLLFGYFWVGLIVTGLAQKPVEVSVEFITNQALLEVTVDVEPFAAFMKPAIDLLETSLAAETQPMRVAARYAVHPDADPEVTILHTGELDAGKAASLEAALAKLPAYRSRLTDVYYVLIADVLPGKRKAGKTYKLDIVSPYDADLIALRKASLAAKEAHIREWARTYAIPVLAGFQHQTDPQFEGVRAMGKILSTLDLTKPINVPQLTDHSYDFWRATLEMAPGNQLMPMTRIALLTANGEFDHARLYLGILGPFMRENSIAFHLAEGLQARLEIFYGELETRINEGLKLHDRKAYAEAIALYDNLLAVYPHSAWAKYERYYSTNSLALEKGQPLEDRSLWDAAKPGIYQCNPMYEMDVRSSNAVEGYLLFRRQKIGTLFKDPRQMDEDLKELAMIAIDLKAYGFAAQLSAMLMVRDKAFTEPFLRYFLFCLNKLGDTELRKNFKGDYDKVFREIEKERQRAMEKDPMYKMFDK